MEKKNWANYYFFEKTMLNTLREEAHILYDCGYPNKLDLNDTQSKPPRYVRAVLQAKNKESYDRCLESINIFRSSFLTAIGKSSVKTLPKNDPNIIEDVEQINVFVNDAYMSRNLKRDCLFIIYTEICEPNSAPLGLEIADSLRAIGIDPIIKSNGIDFLIEINTNDLFHYFKTENIQARKYSGKQYRALIRKKSETKGYREKLGIILLAPNQDDKEVLIFNSIKQAMRPHSLEKIGTELKFEFQLEWKFYKKD